MAAAEAATLFWDQALLQPFLAALACSAGVKRMGRADPGHNAYGRLYNKTSGSLYLSGISCRLS